MPVGELLRVEQVRGQRFVPALDGIAVDVAVTEEPLDRWLLAAPSETNDHNMHVGLPTRVRAPRECPVRKRNL